MNVRLAIAILFLASPACAAPLPDWALGRWIAVSALVPAPEAARGQSYLDHAATVLADTQLLVSPTTLQLSNTPFSRALTWGTGVTANLGQERLSAETTAIWGPSSVIGAPLTTDPDGASMVPTLSLTMATCAEDGGVFETQTTPRTYRFARIRRNCSEYRIMRFPDNEHIAIFRMDIWTDQTGTRTKPDGLLILQKSSLD